VSWFAQDARSYAFVTALAVAASYLLLQVLDSGGQRRWLAAYAAGLVVLGLFNIFSLLLVPAHAVTVALTARRRRGGPGLACGPAGRGRRGPGPCWAARSSWRAGRSGSRPAGSGRPDCGAR